MDTEFEAKFYPVNKDKYRARLLSLGAKLILPDHKMRRTIIDGRSHPEFTCHYIHIRDEGNLVRLSAKTHADPEGALSDQKEIDVVVSDYDKTIRIFESMGFKFDRYQETLREVWHFQDAEITIDTWPGLEPYSEIEAGSEAQVKHIAEIIGFDWTKKIITACPEIFMEVYHLELEEVLDKVSNVTFENNPFADLPKFPIVNSQLGL